MIPYDNFANGVVILLMLAILYYSEKYRFYRRKYERAITKDFSKTERTELEKKRFMKNSENKWGVIK